jgi:dipeptidyl aminopeptidase/acylaminoacyl peptidase
LLFPGESHGFRGAETIERAVQAELYFFARAFGVILADDVPPIAIENG